MSHLVRSLDYIKIEDPKRFKLKKNIMVSLLFNGIICHIIIFKNEKTYKYQILNQKKIWQALKLLLNYSVFELLSSKAIMPCKLVLN